MKLNPMQYLLIAIIFLMAGLGFLAVSMFQQEVVKENLLQTQLAEAEKMIFLLTSTSTNSQGLAKALKLLPSDLRVTWAVNVSSQSDFDDAFVITATKVADTIRGTATDPYEETNSSEYQEWYVYPEGNDAHLLGTWVPGHPGVTVEMNSVFGVTKIYTEMQYRKYIAREDFILDGKRVGRADFQEQGKATIAANGVTTTIELAPKGICDSVKRGEDSVGKATGLLINGKEYKFLIPRSYLCNQWPYYEDATYDYQTIADPVFNLKTRWGDWIDIGDVMRGPEVITFTPARNPIY